MFDMEIPEEFIVVYCEDCKTNHAPIRECPEPGSIWDTNTFPYVDVE